MTVICVSPSTLTVREGLPNVKPVAHSSSSSLLKRKVQFNNRVRIRRTVALPRSDEEFQAIWFTSTELFERRRKDKKLRYAVARQPHVFATDQLLSLGLYTESDRRRRYTRTIAARVSILSQLQQQQQQQQDYSMDVDSSSGSDSSDDASTTSSSHMSPSSYAFHSEAAATEARERGFLHSKHVSQVMAKEEDDTSSQGDMSQVVLSATTTSSEKAILPPPPQVCIAQ